MNQKQVHGLAKWLSIIAYKQPSSIHRSYLSPSLHNNFFCKICKEHMVYQNTMDGHFFVGNGSYRGSYRFIVNRIREFHPHWFEFSILCVGLDRPKWLNE